MLGSYLWIVGPFVTSLGIAVQHYEPEWHEKKRRKKGGFCFVFFSHGIPAHSGAPQYLGWLQKIAYKHSADQKQIIICHERYIPRPSEDTTVLFLL